MTPQGHDTPAETVHILLVLAAAEDRAALRKLLQDSPFHLQVLAVRDWAEALPYVESRPLDVVVGDLTAWEGWRAAGEEVRSLPFCVLVPPGEAERAARVLETSPAEVLPQTRDSWRMLPALLRRALRRQALSREEMARVIRHEVNNPLTGILGNAELVLAGEKVLSDKMRQRLTTIIELTVRLRDVVSGLEKRLRGNPNGGSPRARSAVELLNQVRQ